MRLPVRSRSSVWQGQIVTLGPDGFIWSLVGDLASAKPALGASAVNVANGPTESTFAPTSAGLAELRTQILQYRKRPVALVIDLAAEQFEVIVLSELRRGSCDRVLTAMAAQRFSDADLVGATVCPEQSTDGRPRALLLGVRGNDLLRGTLRVLELDEVSVQGIYSLPRLVAQFSRTALGGGPALVMSWSGRNALRQTAVSAGGLIASRVLSRVREPGTETDFAQWLQGEVDRFIQTLANRDLLHALPAVQNESALEVGFLCRLAAGHADAAADVADASPRATHQAICQFLKQRRIAGHYQTSPLRRQTQLACARRASVLGGLAFLLMAGVLSTANVHSGLKAMKTLRALQREASGLAPNPMTPAPNPLQQNTQTPHFSMPEGISGASMLAAVNWVERLPLSVTPTLLMQEISAALERAPAIQIDALEWHGPELGGSVDCREWATLKGRHTKFYGHYAASMKAIEGFVVALARSAHIAEVVPLRMPVGVSTERAVVAHMDTSTRQSDIEFALQIVAFPTVCGG